MILEITMSSLVNPRWNMLLVGASASSYTDGRGQVPDEIPGWLGTLCIADLVKDPRADALAGRYPGRVNVVVSEAKDAAPALLRRGNPPLIAMSYAGQMWDSSLKEWSILLGVSEEEIARLQEEGRVVLLGIGCGAPPISNWENLFKALTKENLALLAKASQVLPLSAGGAPSFFRVVRDTSEYPPWADDMVKEAVARQLGVQVLPPARGYFLPLFRKRVGDLLGKEPSEKADEELREESNTITQLVDKIWDKIFGEDE